MVKHTKTIHRQKPKNCLSVFDYFVGLTLKGLKNNYFDANISTSLRERNTLKKNTSECGSKLFFPRFRYRIYRGSRLEVFCQKKVFLEISQNSQENTRLRVL